MSLNAAALSSKQPIQCSSFLLSLCLKFFLAALSLQAKSHTKISVLHPLTPLPIASKIVSAGFIHLHQPNQKGKFKIILKQSRKKKKKQWSNLQMS